MTLLLQCVILISSTITALANPLSILKIRDPSFATRLLSKSAQPVFEILYWYGRSGNNYMQLSNAIYWAACCKGIVKAPKHSLFPSPMITNFSLFTDYSYPHNSTDPHCTKGMPNEIMFGVHLPTGCSFKNRSIVNNYVIFDNIKEQGVPHRHFPCTRNCGAESENILTIFFRGGDIMSGSPPFTYYRQPPLYFYETVINSQKWEKIVIVTAATDYVNPVWKYYFDHCDDKFGKDSSSYSSSHRPEVEFVSLSSLNETVSVLLNAVHLVGAQSSFTSMISDATTMAKTIFHPGSGNRTIFRGIPLPNYFEKQLNSSAELVDWMLHYKP